MFGSLVTTQSVSVPHCSKWLLRLSSVVSKLNPPMKSFRSCSGSLGDSDLDMTAVEAGKTSTMLSRWRPRAGPMLFSVADKVSVVVVFVHLFPLRRQSRSATAHSLYPLLSSHICQRRKESLGEMKERKYPH